MLRLNSPDTGVDPSSIIKPFILHKALQVQSGRQWLQISDDCKIISNLIDLLRKQFSIAESTEFSLFMENSRLRPQSSIQVLRGSSSPVMVMPTLIGMESIRKSQKGPSSAQVNNSTGERGQSLNIDTSNNSTGISIDDCEALDLSTMLEPLTVVSAFEANDNRPKTSKTRHETKFDLNFQSNSSQRDTPPRSTHARQTVIKREQRDSVIVNASILTSIDGDLCQATIKTEKSSDDWYIGHSDDDDFTFSPDRPLIKLPKIAAIGTSDTSTISVKRVTPRKPKADINYRPVNISEIKTGSWIRFRRASAIESEKKTYRRNYLVMEIQSNGSFKAIALNKDGKSWLDSNSGQTSKTHHTFKWSEITDLELRVGSQDEEFLNNGYISSSDYLTL